MTTRKSKKITKSNGNNEPKDSFPFPFQIEACEEECSFDFPIHTHGLAKFGWPEFFTYSSAFGLNGGRVRIALIYHYLSRPENASLLTSVIKGDLVKISHKDLHPGEMDTFPVTYCMKLVSTGFVNVREQCEHLSSEFPSGTEFKLVQIWAEGDNKKGKDGFGVPITGGYIN